MENSNNFFQLVAEFQKNIDSLNQILKGSDVETVIIDGVVKPTISKDIADKWSAISAMVQGRAAYETKASLPSTPPSGVVLAEVWRDPIEEYNGLYGWTGTEWEKSQYDNYTNLVGLIDAMDKEYTSKIDSLGVESMNQSNHDSDDTNIMFAVADESGVSPLAIGQKGEVRMGDSQLETGQVTSIEWAIMDSKGNTPLYIDEDGGVNVGESSLEVTKSQGVAWCVTDNNGQYPLAINEDGSVSIGDATHEAVSSYMQWAVVDNNGQAALYVDKDGKVHIPDLVADHADNVTEDIDEPRYKCDVNQIFTYGQSLSRGAGSRPPLTTTSPYGNLMFGDGMHACGYDDGYLLNELVPAIEQINPAYTSDGETPNSGTMNYATELGIAREGAADHTELGYVFLGSSPGYGGFPIASLSKGSARYKGMMEQVQAANDLCKADNKTHCVYAVTWTHGSNDYVRGTSKAQYQSALKKLMDDVCVDVKSITGQKFNPIFITSQVASHRRRQRDYTYIAEAQYELMIEDSRLTMIYPIYAAEHLEDNLHLTNDGSRMLGYHYGVILDHMVANGEVWKPCMPLNITTQGKVIDITCNVPNGRLVIDTSWVTQAPNYGFDVWDDENGVHLDIIDTVELVGKNRIRITMSSEAPLGTRLCYARGRVGDPDHASRKTGPRGNIRDQMGDIHTYTMTDGSVVRMDNYLTIFNLPIYS